MDIKAYVHVYVGILFLLLFLASVLRVPRVLQPSKCLHILHKKRIGSGMRYLSRYLFQSQLLGLRTFASDKLKAIIGIHGPNCNNPEVLSHCLFDDNLILFGNSGSLRFRKFVNGGCLTASPVTSICNSINGNLIGWEQVDANSVTE